jgi:propanediol dehydratase large subunit
MLHRITRTMSTITRAIRAMTTRALDQIRHGWNAHVRLLRDNPAYAAAAAAGAAAIAGQDNRLDLIAAAAAALLALYAATRRNATRWELLRP